MPPATLPTINASITASAVLQADNMVPTSVLLLSESYFQQLHMMHTAGGQKPLANPPPSQTDNASSGLYLHSKHPILSVNTSNTHSLDSPIRHLVDPHQAQTLAALAPCALQFSRGSFITMSPRGSQSQLAEAPSSQARNASLSQDTQYRTLIIFTEHG